MATETGGSQPTSRAKAKVSPMRNVLALLLLIVLVVIFGIELKANMSYNSASKKLDQAVKGKEDGLLSQDDVEKMIGKQPDGHLVEEQGLLKAKYTWHGVFRTYGLTAEYRKGDKPALQSYASMK